VDVKVFEVEDEHIRCRQLGAGWRKWWL